MARNIYLPLARQHVRAGSRWMHEAGTDYWLMPAGGAVTDPFGAASTATGDELAENGWTCTSLVNTVGSAGDLLGGVPAATPADAGVPNHALGNATGDLLVSPVLFGDYGHALMAANIAGKKRLPNRLVLEAYAAFTVATADEPTSGFGFFEDATTTTSATEALQLAFISSNSANFELNTNASTTLTDAGAAVDNAWHLWKIELLWDTAGVVRANWYIDGSHQGYIVPTNDEAPYAFGAHNLTTNRLGLGWVHIYYDWK